MLRPCLSLALCLLLAACHSEAPDAGAQVAAKVVTSGDGGDFGAVSTVQPVPTLKSDLERSTDWPPAKVESGHAFVSCETDYALHGDGMPLVNLEFFSVLDAMTMCQERGVVRLRYQGKIAGDFITLVERIAEMATRMGIPERILDIDSSGGHVEDAIVAGDSMAESHWTIWVREDAVCHSACVLVLAAGDNRLIAGKVGVHRIIRLQSKATSRAELNRELSEVHAQIEAYLERNGAASAVADLMMTIPNRNLRVLSAEELSAFGLDGANAAQDDLERIRLARECGEDFVRRRDAYNRAFDSECAAPKQSVEVQNTCGLALRGRFGFPDQKCRAESPMAEYQ
ncbi:MAG: hypothetical protein H7Y19_10685 [Luteimonas sp.]|nr:hypothetical protein [Luteimonas sp.]